MLKKFKVKNYKNFKNEIEIDFTRVAGYQFNKDCIIQSTIGKMLIYGKNGTGKTNLGKAILDIRNILTDIAKVDRGNSSLLNVLAEENEVEFYYEFLINKKKIKFQYTKNEKSEIVKESLRIGRHLIFKMDYKEKEYLTDNIQTIGVGPLNVKRFIDGLENAYIKLFKKDSSELSFLRWILANSLIEGTVLKEWLEYIENMHYLQTNLQDDAVFEFDEALAQRYVGKLQDYLIFMGIQCELSYDQLPNGERKLYFKFENGKKILFYENASSGTLSLTNLFRDLVYGLEDKSFLYIDEFDAFYHYELAEKLIEWIKSEYPKTQAIITTHNTNLMNNQLMRPDCLCILSEEGKLTPLCDATERELREGHNLEKMYISGEFAEYE